MKGGGRICGPRLLIVVFLRREKGGVIPKNDSDILVNWFSSLEHTYSYFLSQLGRLLRLCR